MATYYAERASVAAATTAAQSKTIYDGTQAIAEPYGCDITVPFAFSTALTATAHTFVTADTVRLVKLPKGAVIFNYKINFPVLDTSTGLTWSLGLGVKTASTLVFVSSSVASKSSGVATIGPVVTLIGTTLSAPATTIAQALPYAELTADDYLLLTATAGTTTAGAGGTITGTISYIFRPTVF